MIGNLKLHDCQSVTVGQIIRCGENGQTVFRRIIIENTDGQQFEVTVFGESEIIIKDSNNE